MGDGFIGDLDFGGIRWVAFGVAACRACVDGALEVVSLVVLARHSLASVLAPPLGVGEDDRICGCIMLVAMHACVYHMM